MKQDALLVRTPLANAHASRYRLRVLCGVWMLCLDHTMTANAQPSNFDLAKPQAEYMLGPGMIGNCPVRVAIRPAPWLLIRSGYCPIVIRLRPVAGNVFLSDGTLTVRFLSSYGTDQRNATVDIHVQAGQPFVEKELLFNSSASGNRNMTVTCDWNGVNQSYMQAMFYVSYSNVLSSEFNQRLTLISEASSARSAERKTALAEIKNFQIPISLSGLEPATQSSTYRWRTHYADIANLPTGWLRIGAFDQVSADIEDLEHLDASGWETLKDFIWCGGTLMVGDLKNLERLKKLVSADWSRPLVAEPPFQGQVFQAGFGKVALSKSSAIDSYSSDDELRSKSRSERLSNFLGDEYWNWLIPEVGKTPVWTFFAFVVLVVGIAAPGIMVWSQRVKRRIWIVLAIPALAIASTASLFLYGAIKDGWGSIVRIRSLTWVDSEGEGAAWSRQSYFAGSLPGNRLRIAPDAELVALKGKRDLRTMQYQSDTEQVYSGLLPLRQQKQFSITHPVRDLKVFRRAAASDSASDSTSGSSSGSTTGQPSMINALDCTILGAVYCDPEGQVFQSDAVAAGEPMAWEACTADAAREMLLKLFNQQPLVVPADAPDQNSRSMLEMFRSRYRYWYQPTGGMESFIEETRWQDALRLWDKQAAGKFVVFVERAPHVERCLPDCRETNSLHTIVGQWIKNAD